MMEDNEKSKISESFNISVIDTDNGQELLFKNDFSFGKGINYKEDSCLVRPYRRFLDDELYRPGSVKFIFYKDGNQYHVLGTLVYTSAKRISFFPGIIGRTILRPPGKLTKKNLETGDANEGNIEQVFDHITMESDFQSSHLKLLDRDLRYENLKPQKVEPSFYRWFQLQIPKISYLEKVPSRQESRLIIPQKVRGLAKKITIMLESKNKGFDCISIFENFDDPYFFAFEFTISDDKKKPFPKLPLVNIDEPSFIQIDNSRENGKENTFKILLKGFDGALWIRTFLIPGKMGHGTFFISAENFPLSI